MTKKQIMDLAKGIAGDDLDAKAVVEKLSGFRFEIGKTYETQAGELVKVLGRTGSVGYECLICSDGKHRYDRSTSRKDAGRVTGTAHDYSCPDNFKRDDRKP